MYLGNIYFAICFSKMYLGEVSVRNSSANTEVRGGEDPLRVEETMQGHVDIL